MNLATKLPTLLSGPEHASPVRYQHYAFTETSAGNLTGVYGEFRGNALAPVTVPAVEPFRNRRGDFEKTRGFHGATLVTAGAWLSRDRNLRPAYALQFEDHWRGAPGQLRAWEPDTESEREGICELVRGVSLSGDGLNAWLQTPAERSAAYLQWFSQVSLDMQAAFRRWLPYLLLRDEAILNDAALRNSLLFYAATKPYLARVRGAFTWDVICPESMASVFRGGAQNLPRVLEQAQQYALAGGHTALAETLAPTETRLVMIHVRRDPRVLKGLLTLEGNLVEAVLALGIKGREIGASKLPPKNLHRYCAAWSRGVQTRLRRVLGAVGAPRLVDLALVEGTASVARCAGLEPQVRRWSECRGSQPAAKVEAGEHPLAA
jgi:hypothetical protein